MKFHFFSGDFLADKNPRLKIIGICSLIFWGWIIYSNSFHASFQFDDYPAIVENVKLYDIGNFTSIYKFYINRFVGFYTFALNFYFGKFDVVGYHLVNWVIHCFVSLMILWLMQVTLLIFEKKTREPIRYKFLLSWLTALLFLSHPIQTEAVTYIYQRITSLSTLFCLLSLYFYIKGRQISLNDNFSFGPKKFLFCFGFFLASGGLAVLAMFTKEIAIVLPVVVVLYEYFFLREAEPSNRRDKKEVIKTNMIRAGSLLIILLFTYILPAFHQFNFIDRFMHYRFISESHDYEKITFGQYFLTQMRMIVFSLRLLFIPLGQNIDHDIVLSKSIIEPGTLFSLAAVLSIIVSAVRLRPKYLLLKFGIFWFLVTYSINFIPKANIFFEHYLYWPSIGFCIFLVMGVYHLSKDIKRFSVIVMAVIVVFSFLTYQRNQIWQTPFTLWGDMIHKSPNKARGYDALGTAYLRRGELDKAIEYYQKSLEINSELPNTYLNLGNVYRLKNNYELALNYYQEALKRSSVFAQSRIYNNIANIYFAMKQYDLALGVFNDVIKEYPQDKADLMVYNNRGAIYKMQGKYDLALADYNTIIAVDAYNVEAYYNRGLVYGLMKQYDLALADYNKAISLKPDYADAYHNRGVIFKLKKEYANAMADFQKAISLKSDKAIYYFNRGTIYVLENNNQAARADFTTAINLEPNNPRLYVARGDLFLKLQQKDAAMADYDKALSLDSGFKDAYVKRIQSLQE